MSLLQIMQIVYAEAWYQAKGGVHPRCQFCWSDAIKQFQFSAPGLRMYKVK